MAGAGLDAPMHEGKQAECFTDVRQNHHHQTGCAEERKKTSYRPFSSEQNYGETHGQQNGNECEQRSEESPTHTVGREGLRIVNAA